MTEGPWGKVRQVLESALEQPAEEREAFVRVACGADEALRGEVLSLLARTDRADRLLEPSHSSAPIEPGRKLGPYEIVEAIGEGGMGVVYKAKDTRLDRTVAIKVLPHHLPSRDERRARFEHEARMVSRLSHPNICTLYDVGEEDGVNFLVMEYIEGETLADRIARGALTWQEAVRHGIELADALDKAHRAGVIHRDLKPGNVILTKSGAKLLDFGLAKLQEEPVSALDSLPRTNERPLTKSGMILGTLQYMSPEQAEGKQADARSDIFALGAVLYEMVAGERAFRGESSAGLIAAILSETPKSLSEFSKLTPPALDRVVSTCLEKDPDERFQSAADLRKNLEWVAPETAASKKLTARRSFRALRVLGALAAVTAVGFAIASLASRPSVPENPSTGARHLQVELGDHLGMAAGVSAHVAVSPNGRHLAFVLNRGGPPQLFLRDLTEPEARYIPGTEGAMFPFFSPDSEWIAFQTMGPNPQVKRVSVHGGSPQTVHEYRDITTGLLLFGGGAWTEDGTIVLTTNHRGWGVYTVPSVGGTLEIVSEPRMELEEGWIVSPSALPDGKSILATATMPERSDAVWLSLETGEERVVVEHATQAAYSPTGHILFVRGGALWAARFDAERGELLGRARPFLEGVEERVSASFAVSNDGLLAYVPGREGPFVSDRLIWVDPGGGSAEAVSDRRGYGGPTVSPTGDRVAVVVEDARIYETSEIWLLDVEGERLDRFTFHEGRNVSPVWMPNGREIVFESDRGAGAFNLYRKRLGSSGVAELILESTELMAPQDVSPDGRVLAIQQGGDIKLVTLESKTVTPIVVSEATELEAAFSPDGQYLAYSSNETGRFEIYVSSLASAGKTQLTYDGGRYPEWSDDQTSLFYLDVSGSSLRAIELSQTAELRVLSERVVVDVPQSFNAYYDVHPSGDRFLLIDKTRENLPDYLNVVTSFHALVE